MSKIGIMGGSFNPIHFGHLMLAECAREEFRLDEVWFVPTGYSYMKQNDSEGKGPLAVERLEMTRLATEGNSYFQCLDIEVQRKGNTYTYETLQELKSKYPENNFYFIFGADCLYGIEHWKEPEQIFNSCEIVAALRTDFVEEDMQTKINELQEKYNARIHFLPFREIALSSTDIRERVRKGKSIHYMVPESVIFYIEEKGFYST
ncbi:MAG: nicotinate-nucleotide adenylyltransferase [Lachnospiraceae bacterium]|nr:nicotinate-nucleotide adenylyltransferase [Lachnospiraceae bacterium]